VRALVRTAQFIVVGIEEMTPGIRWELECIRSSGRAEDSVVVLAAGDDWTVMRHAAREAAAIDREYPPVTKETAELAGFARVIGADELPDALEDLVRAMEAVARLDPEARVRHAARLLD
jgi:hypothetical protein